MGTIMMMVRSWDSDDDDDGGDNGDDGNHDSDIADDDGVLEEGRDAHNITANAASRFSFESALEEERWHKILQTMRSSQYF